MIRFLRVALVAFIQACVGIGRGFDVAQTLIHDRGGVIVERRDPEELAETLAVLEQLRQSLCAKSAIEVALMQTPRTFSSPTASDASCRTVLRHHAQRVVRAHRRGASQPGGDG